MPTDDTVADTVADTAAVAAVPPSFAHGPRLNGMCRGLARERASVVKGVAKNSRFHELRQDEKQLICGMLKELTEYERYLHTIRDAVFLNKSITMVQSFCQKKTRELYLDISALVGRAFGNTFDSFLFELQEAYIRHDRLRGYLNCQHFRSWAIGSSWNQTHKFKPLFRYSFPECDFDRPLVIRNPDVCYENAAKMLYTLVDVSTKFKGTRAVAISNTDLLWLGRCELGGTASLKPGACAEHLWLCVATRSAAAGTGTGTGTTTHGTCTTYNAVWFPQFNMYVQFKCLQRQCNDDLRLNWAESVNCCDEPRQRALFERCQQSRHNGGDGATVAFELYTRPVVDWELYCPFTLSFAFTQHDGADCPNDAAHVTSQANRLYEVESVREDYLLVLSKSSGIRAGTYVRTEFETCTMAPDRWKPPLAQLLHFYKSVLANLDMQLLQTESQTKQIASVSKCIANNIAMYQDLIGEYVHVDNVQAVNKIRKLNELIETVQTLISKEPLTVVASSKHETRAFSTSTRTVAAKAKEDTPGGGGGGEDYE
jgi:hypothetical protein